MCSRLLVIGADGMDPAILERLVAQGQLPHLACLLAEGAFGRLATTFPPVSPVAWTSFLTGQPPAQHGIWDFVTKAPRSYRPTIGLFEISVGQDGLPRYHRRRRALTLGQRLTAAGRRCLTLRVPATFPPDPDDGEMLAGFGMPDLVGSFGTSAVYTTYPDDERFRRVRDRRLVRPLEPAGDGWYEASIPGPADTTASLFFKLVGRPSPTPGPSLSRLDDRRGRGVAPSPVARSAGEGRTGEGVGGEGRILLIASRPAEEAVLLALSPGQWSSWLTMAFQVPGRGAVSGILRLKVLALADDYIAVYRTPVQCDPRAPLYPLTAPPELASELAAALGLFATLGLPADQTGLQQGLIDEDTFLEDAYHAWEEQRRIVRYLLQQRDWDCLIAHFFTIDVAQHLFWHHADPAHPAHDPALAARYGDEIARAYRWLDTVVGELLALVDEDTTVVVVSDHGGAPIYRHVYLNAWLRERGYLQAGEGKGQEKPVDWEHTRAVGFGTGGIFLNVRGREPRGVVELGPEYGALRQEIATALLNWRDPQTGQPVVKEVLFREQYCAGSESPGLPDLWPAFQRGYGLGRGEALGRVREEPVVEPNRETWSGGHEGPYLPEDIPGVVIIRGPGCPARTTLEGMRITDLAAILLDMIQ